MEGWRVVPSTEMGEIRGDTFGGGKDNGFWLGHTELRCLHDILMEMSSRQVAIRSKVLE